MIHGESNEWSSGLGYKREYLMLMSGLNEA